MHSSTKWRFYLGEFDFQCDVFGMRIDLESVKLLFRQLGLFSSRKRHKRDWPLRLTWTYQTYGMKSWSLWQLTLALKLNHPAWLLQNYSFVSSNWLIDFQRFYSSVNLDMTGIKDKARVHGRLEASRIWKVFEVLPAKYKFRSDISHSVVWRTK